VRINAPATANKSERNGRERLLIGGCKTALFVFIAWQFSWITAFLSKRQIVSSLFFKIFLRDRLVGAVHPNRPEAIESLP
jgi:hypothetical protein